jgi:hypothetical protein
VSPADFDFFLTSTIALCAVMALINLLLIRRRGASGLFMAGAFLAVGAGAFAFRARAPQPVVVAAGVLAVVLLALDAAYRMGGSRQG